MIIFHEGLPGAGKSYETCVEHIIPALMKGRKVFAYIEGLNYEKFSEVTLMPLEIIQRYLVQIEREQVKEIYKLVEKDSLVVIDELQNFWPSTREKPKEEISKFVTEHRHLGLDIVCMGQDIRDCHTIWRRRVEQKTVYTKLTAVGRDNSYKWVVYRAQAGEKFQKISSGTKNYQKKYFGLYASYEAGAENTKTYKDKRAVIWNNPIMKYGIPLFIIILFFSAKHLYSFFGMGEKPKIVSQARIPTNVQGVMRQQGMQSGVSGAMSPGGSNQAPVKAEPPPPPPLDIFDELVQKYRARLKGVVSLGLGYSRVYIDILDNTFHIKDTFTSEELKLMGWKLKMLGKTMVRVEKEEKVYLVRNWPIDPFGKVADNVSHSSEVSGN